MFEDSDLHSAQLGVDRANLVIVLAQTEIELTVLQNGNSEDEIQKRVDVIQRLKAKWSGVLKPQLIFPIDVEKNLIQPTVSASTRTVQPTVQLLFSARINFAISEVARRNSSVVIG